MNRLEFIALACGYEIHRFTEPDEEGYSICILRIDGKLHTWNPETDPADCFRAMVDGGIDVTRNDKDGEVCAKKTGSQPKDRHIKWELFKDHNGNKLAATMKSICDCLEAIGRSMNAGEES